MSAQQQPPAAAGTVKSDPYAAFRHGAFRRFLPGNFLFNLGRLGMSVAIGTQVYEWTHSAAALGFLGLLNVLPLIALVLPSGVLADRCDRRKIIAGTMAASFVLYALLAAATHFHAALPTTGTAGDALRAANGFIRDAAAFFTTEADVARFTFDDPRCAALPVVFALQFLLATAFVAGNPARAALVPRLVPPAALTNAFRWNSSAFELAVTLGLLLGGLVATWSFTAVYAFAAFAAAALGAAMLGLRLEGERGAGSGERGNSAENEGQRDKGKGQRAATGGTTAQGSSRAGGVHAAALPPRSPTASAGGAFAGIPFIWRHKPVLAAITLDLFAVLFGGVVALFPIYAKEVFAGVTLPFLEPETAHRFITGLLRAAPAVGAVAMAVAGAYLPPFRKPGIALLWTVAGFGAALLVFALSQNLWLSLAALFLSGMCDNVSVIIRHTLVQALTPDALRGRVSSVNQLFIGCSNDISELRGGLVAAQFGTVTAAVSGAIATLLTVAGVAGVFKSLRRLAPLEELKPEDDRHGK